MTLRGKIFKALLLAQAAVLTYLALPRLIWYITIPRGQLPLIEDFISGFITLFLVVDWFLTIII
jgi:hypothetical protein